MKAIKHITAITVAALLAGCATLTESPMTSIALSFSNGESGTCTLTNKRAAEFQNEVSVPATVLVRKSDDALVYRCETASGKRATGAIPSRMGGKIVASAVFLDFGIVDAMTDNHREYPPVFVIPVRRDGSVSNGGGTSVVDDPRFAPKGQNKDRTTVEEWESKDGTIGYIEIEGIRLHGGEGGGFQLWLVPCKKWATFTMWGFEPNLDYSNPLRVGFKPNALMDISPKARKYGEWWRINIYSTLYPAFFRHDSLYAQIRIEGGKTVDVRFDLSRVNELMSEVRMKTKAAVCAGQ